MTLIGGDMKQNHTNFNRIFIMCLLIVLFFLMFNKTTNAAEPIIKYATDVNHTNSIPLDKANIQGIIWVRFPSVKDNSFKLSWLPNTDNNTEGYRLFQGITETEATTKIGQDIIHDPNNLKTNINHPDNKPAFVKTVLVKDLTLDATLKTCFRLKAYNVIGESGFSEALCTTVRQIESVSFYLDDPNLSGAPKQVEKTVPYDFTNAAGFDTSTIAPGAHTLTAAVKYKNIPAIVKYTAGFSTVKKSLSPKGLAVQQILTY